MAFCGFCFTILGYVVMGLILLIIGILMAVNSFHTELTITTTGSQTKTIYFIIFEKEKAVLAANEIMKLVAERMDDTNVRQQTDRTIQASEQQTDRLVEAIGKKISVFNTLKPYKRY